MNSYTVSFIIEVEADNPRDAAITFWDIVLDYVDGIGSGFFEVEDEQGKKTLVELPIVGSNGINER